MNSPDSEKQPRRDDGSADAEAVADLEATEHDDVKGAKKKAPDRVMLRAKTPQ